MPRFAANISMLFTELDFPDRFAAASEAGFSGVEIHVPYQFSADELAQWAQAANVEIVLINAPAGDHEIREPGIACRPERVEEFRESIKSAVEYANILTCSRVNILAGRCNDDSRLSHQTLVNNLTYAADALAQINANALLEPINGVDVSDYMVQTTGYASECIIEVDRENMKLQLDIYHRQVSEGNIARALRDYYPLIGHIQFADSPGRHQPGTGGIDFPDFFRQVEQTAYKSWLGAEYIPEGKTSNSLDWLQATL